MTGQEGVAAQDVHNVQNVQNVHNEGSKDDMFDPALLTGLDLLQSSKVDRQTALTNVEAPLIVAKVRQFINIFWRGNSLGSNFMY